MNYAKTQTKKTSYVSINTLIQSKKSKGLSALPPYAQFQKEQGLPETPQKEEATPKNAIDSEKVPAESVSESSVPKPTQQVEPSDGSGLPKDAGFEPDEADLQKREEKETKPEKEPKLVQKKGITATSNTDAKSDPKTPNKLASVEKAQTFESVQDNKSNETLEVEAEIGAAPDGTNEREQIDSSYETISTAQQRVQDNGGKEVTGKKSGEKQDNVPAMEKITIQSGEPNEILEQLQKVPPTSAIDAYGQAQEVSNTALEKQRDQIQQGLPEIPAPTGLTSQGTLPARQEKKELTLKTKPLTSFKSEKSGRKGNEYQVQAYLAPAKTGREVSLEGGKGGSTDESELTKNAETTLEGIHLDTNSIITRAGERPAVDVTGEADSSQIDSFQNESHANVQQAKAEAAQEVNRDFGENDIFPEAKEEKLKSKKTLSAPKKILAGKEEKALPLTLDVADGLNQTLAPVLAKRIGDQKERYDAGKAQFDKDSVQARVDADQQVVTLNQETRKQQIAEQHQAKAEVTKYRREFQAEQAKVEQAYQEKAAQASAEQRKKIQSEQQKGEAQATQHLAEAERKAEAEKLKAQQEAGQKKADAKKESKGFWGWVKSAAVALLDGLKKAINFIYDNLRKAVKGIFEAAKALVKSVIELARMAIVGYIKAYGLILKGLVSVVFAAFPEIAKKINSKIDQAVNAAVKAVNQAADMLKKGVTAVFDFLANTLDSLLGLVQKIYNGIFDAIGMIIRGEFKKIMEGVGNLVAAARAMPDQFWGQVSEELLGTNLAEPLPFERKAVAEPIKATELTEEISGISDQDKALFNRSVLSENDVAVDEVVQDEFDPELIASLNLKEGDEVEFGASNDPSRTVAAIKEEMLGKPISPNTTPNERETAAQSESALTQEEIAEQELRQLMAQEPEGCSATEKPAEPAKESEIPESMKIGPLTVGQRTRYLVNQMQKGLRQWFAANWPKLLLAAVGALVGFIALNIITGGAIMAALPLIMQIVSAVMAGVAIGKVIDYIGQYLGDGWAGLKEKAAKSLARGLAVGAIELIFALIFNLGTVIKTLKTGLTASVKTAAKAVKATITTTIKNVRELGRIGLQAGKTMIKNGKMLFKGLKAGFSKGAKSMGDLAKRLWERVRFKKFKLVFKQGWIILYGYINPGIVLAKIRAREVKEKLSEMRQEIAQVVEEGEVVLESSKKGATFKKYIELSKPNKDKIAQILKKNKELIQEAKQLKKTGALDEGVLDDFLFQIEGHHAVPKWMGGPDIPYTAKDELLGVARMLHNFDPSGVHSIMNQLWNSSKRFGKIAINDSEAVRSLFRSANAVERKRLLSELRNILTNTYKQVFKEGPAFEHAIEVMEEGLKQFRY